MNPGDVVTLNSGGPEMTVTSVDSDGYVNVVWFQEASGQSFAGLLYINERVGRFLASCLTVEKDDEEAK